ncbi:MAG TPA: hypothetical protein VLK65_12240 [Vicinamibacteria bacterium]|nr:hypothetical protein [Vicinamibacteria bacterium]
MIDRVGGDEGVMLRALYGLLAASVLEVKSGEPKRPISVQFETGTFVLSEISQNVAAPVPPSPPPPPAPKPAPRTSAPEPTTAPRPIAREPSRTLTPTLPPVDEAHW